MEAALRTALQLRRYDDILDPNLVYAFVALVGFYSSFYGTCSKVTISFLLCLCQSWMHPKFAVKAESRVCAQEGTLYHTMSKVSRW